MARVRRPLILLLLCVWPALAHADDVEAARARFKEGVAFYDKGQYEKARAAFLQALVLKKHPAVVLNLAQSCLKSHHEAEAARYFKEYLADKAATASGTAIAQAGLTEARTRDGRLEIRAPVGVEVFVDDQSVGTAPIELFDVDPGSHVVRLKGGAAVTVTAVAGEIVVAPLGGPPPPPPAPTGPGPTATPTPVPERPLGEMLGGQGESCRARADCESPLACKENICVDPNAPPPKPAATGSPFELRGAHALVGLSVRGGPAWLVTNAGGVTQSDPNLQGSFAVALRAGLLVGKSELAVEISPFTEILYRNIPPAFTGPAFGATLTYGYYAPLHEGQHVAVYWPIRFGVGVLAGANNTGGLAYFQGRLDLIGFAVRVDHVLLGFEIPSARYAFTTRNGAWIHLFAWRPGATLSYVF